jgi:hypothetical protein
LACLVLLFAVSNLASTSRRQYRRLLKPGLSQPLKSPFVLWAKEIFPLELVSIELINKRISGDGIVQPPLKGHKLDISGFPIEMAPPKGAKTLELYM